MTARVLGTGNARPHVCVCVCVHGSKFVSALKCKASMHGANWQLVDLLQAILAAGYTCAGHDIELSLIKNPTADLAVGTVYERVQRLIGAA